MQTLHLVVITTLLAGLSMTLGAFIARFTDYSWFKDGLRHGILAFGGGALLSAIALVLVPEGILHLSPVWVSFWFLFGGIGFMLLDILLKKINTPASQLAAMLSDFIPESIALGAAFASGDNSAYLLAGLIALQNIPEGYSAFNELNKTTSYRARSIIFIFAAMALLGPASGVSGYLWLSNSPTVISAIMLFASGGILYSIFQDIAPQIKLENHWTPPLGAVLGFLLGLLGYMLI